MSVDEPLPTLDQNPDHRIDALLRHGVDRDNIHVDVAGGAKASRGLHVIPHAPYATPRKHAALA